jgi:rhodanese-related sulfurtransferase
MRNTLASFKRRYSVLLWITILLTASVAWAADDSAMQPKEGWYPNIVDVDFVAQYAVLPKRNDVVIIDSRPKARKYDPGHIPGAISISEREFDQLAPSMLPPDKSTLLILYCGGTKCMLSHKSAFAAEKLGYTNIKVYAAGYPDWIKSGNVGAVSTDYMQKVVSGEKKAVVVDARPKARKYDKGHIPGAVSISEREFDQLAPTVLPADKATPLVFYCGGYKCALSDKSARKAIALGYTNVKTYPAGFPEWKGAGGQVAVTGQEAPKAAAVKKGVEDGTIAIASFKELVDTAPDTIMIVDVRDPADYKRGSFKSAVNIPINDLENELDKLPTDKPIVYICGSGGRSGEAYDITKMLRADLDVYFLDAELTFNADGTYKIEPHAG